MGLISIRKVSIDQARLLPNGKIVITGNFNYIDRVPRRKIAVLNSNGTLDGSFDAETFLLAYTLGGSDYITLAVQPDGKILVDFELYVVRLNSDGRVDNSFHYNPIGGPWGVRRAARSPAEREDTVVLRLLGIDTAEFRWVGRLGLSPRAARRSGSCPAGRKGFCFAAPTTCSASTPRDRATQGSMLMRCGDLFLLASVCARTGWQAPRESFRWLYRPGCLCFGSIRMAAST